MSRILLLLLLVVSTKTFSQSRKAIVNPKYEKAPFRIAKSPIKLSKYLTENDSSEFQKALNIYTWIVNNVKYDVKALSKIKSKTYSPKKTLKRKKGVCYQYSSLFSILCQNAGISSREVIGYSKGFSYFEDDRFFEADHSWNSVKLDSSWYLIDVTWGSGGLHQKKRAVKEIQFRWFKKPYINNKYKFKKQPNYQFFLVEPEFLISNHLPIDPNWQLLEYPISMMTFESSGWKSYLPKMDSLYQKRIDSANYVNRLNKYEYQSGLQYLQSTANQGFLFNPKNSKIVGYSYYSIARSYENSNVSSDRKLEYCSKAIQFHKLAISQLKSHKKIAHEESNFTLKNTKFRVSNELIKPISKRVKKNVQENKALQKSLKSQQKILEIHNERIQYLQNVISKPSRSFKMPLASTIEKPLVVEKNRLEIKRTLRQIDNYQDSVLVIIRSLESHKKMRGKVQSEIINQYQVLIPCISVNINSIVQNFGLTHISGAMQAMDSISQRMDSLILEKKDVDKLIKQEKRTIRQLHSSIISFSSLIRKLIIQNCQLSKNEKSVESLYNASNQKIKSIYKTKLELEKEFLNVAKSDSKFNSELKKAIDQSQVLLEMNTDFIISFRDSRLGGISFKLRKSNFESNLLINSSKKSVRSLTSEVSKLEKIVKIDGGI
ncbi:MAG: hypothetical protein OCD76_14070 [Reichenbachiella sp.]